MSNDAVAYQLISKPEILDEDELLVAEAKEDPKSAGMLYDKYYKEILGYIYHCTCGTDVTEDLTSNVFLTAFRHLGRYKWQQVPFKAWLYRIATNEVRMHWRRQKRITNFSRQISEPAGSDTTGSEHISTQEEYRLLHKAMMELKSKYRTVIILRYFEDKAIVEICRITGKKEGTIKSQLHRGLARLQDILVSWGVLHK